MPAAKQPACVIDSQPSSENKSRQAIKAVSEVVRIDRMRPRRSRGGLTFAARRPLAAIRGEGISFPLRPSPRTGRPRLPVRIVARNVLVAAALIVPIAPAGAQDFYRGKTLTLFAGQPPGGGIDSEMRLVAQFLGKFIPGEPQLLARNMPGAGGMVLGNYLFSVAKPDGLRSEERRVGKVGNC